MVFCKIKIGKVMISIIIKIKQIIVEKRIMYNLFADPLKTLYNRFDSNVCGEVAEWSKATASKAVIPETESWVRIPPSPPSCAYPRLPAWQASDGKPLRKSCSCENSFNRCVGLYALFVRQ